MEQNASHDHPGSVPHWASFFAVDEYAAFDKAVQGYFRSLGKPYKLDGGTIRTNWMNKDSDMQNLGLLNLAQLCKSASKEQYPDIVKNHFEVMRKSQDFISGFFDTMDDFDFVKPFIGTRVYHKDHVQSLGPGGVISQRITDDLIGILVFDMPQAITSVKPDQVNVWGKSANDLLQLGLQNIRENYDFEVQELKARVPLKAVVQNHFFASNVIMEMERYPELLGTHGTLVTVPHRHSVVFHPIEDITIIMAINMMVPMTRAMYKDGPGSISNNIYWHRRGELVTLPYKFVNDQMQFEPPQEFLEMMNYFSAEEQ